ncbi:MAG: glycosyltransferase family 2 protein [Cellulosilyticaceae bacterium]
MDTISIIIPAYNVVQYIERCLESILRQTYKALEIIIVNDGSTDATAVICEAYAKKDERIRLIHQKNQGVAVARNTGIALATGSFIGFVDPDDWVEPQMYEALYTCLKQSPYPVCMCSYYKDSKKGSTPQLFPFNKKSLSRYEVIEEVISPMIGIDDLLPKYTYIMGCVWRCLYRKDFLDQYDLRFQKGITIMEDLVFNVGVLLRAEGICIEEGIWYHYVQNKSSVLHSYNEKMWQDQMRVHDLLEQMLREAGLGEYMRNRLDMRYISMTFSAIYNEINRSSKKSMSEKLKNVVDICSEEKFKATLERAKPVQRHVSLEKIVTGATMAKKEEA